MKKTFFCLICAILFGLAVKADEQYHEHTFYIDGIYYQFSTVDWPSFIPDSIKEKQKPYAYVTNGDTRNGFVIVDTIVSERSTKEYTDYYFPQHGYYKGDVVIPATVTYHDTIFPVVSINDYAFSKCEELTSVEIPDGVKYIGEYAFHGCKQLKEIRLPASLRSLWEGAFTGSGIKEITLPDSIENVALSTFAGARIHFSETPAVYDDGTYSPIFLSVNYGGHRPAIPVSNAGEGCFMLPKSRFHLRRNSLSTNGFKAVIFPDVERFYSHERAFEGKYPEMIVCLGNTPPIVDKTYDWLMLDPDHNRNTPPGYDVSGLMMDYSQSTLIVPKGSEEAYRNADVWKNFPVIRGVESFDEYLGKAPAAVGLPSADAQVSIGLTHSGISVESPQKVTVEVVTLTGIEVERRRVTGSARIDLAPGLYIVKAGTTVRKIKI